MGVPKDTLDGWKQLHKVLGDAIAFEEAEIPYEIQQLDGGKWKSFTNKANCLWSLLTSYRVVRKTHEGWINVYPDGLGHRVHDTREAARKNALPDRVDTLKVTVELGAK